MRSRLSLNQMTVDQWGAREAAEACRRHGISHIGLWRHKIAAIGVAETAKIVREEGLDVSSLCRGGMFPAATPAERAERIADTKRAVDEAAALGAGVLVLVCGPAPDRDIGAARQMVEEGIAAVAPYARERGIQLGIEPLHPMFAADRSVISSLAQATGIAERCDTGVVIDVYHVWWDPDLYREIERARGRILGFHVSDWVAPPPDHLKGRGMMGDGVIEISRIRKAVDAAGYTGPIEIEIFNQALWNSPGDEVMAKAVERFCATV
ncbi:MAG: sugar phosphate isomerase/epimerase [Acidobacteriota bacterium]|nr:sugar phosphate isomerase/epimerase [Acidobacteriota bacterium]